MKAYPSPEELKYKFIIRSKGKIHKSETPNIVE